MPRYHFVVRAPDYTLDDQDGTHFSSHEDAREHGHRIVRELKEDGYNPRGAAVLIQDEAGRFEPPSPTTPAPGIYSAQKAGVVCARRQTSGKERRQG
jgi:hypothetical protein